MQRRACGHVGSASGIRVYMLYRSCNRLQSSLAALELQVADGRSGINRYSYHAPPAYSYHAPPASPAAARERHATMCMSASRRRWKRGKRASVRGTSVRPRSRHIVCLERVAILPLSCWRSRTSRIYVIAYSYIGVRSPRPGWVDGGCTVRVRVYRMHRFGRWLYSLPTAYTLP